MTFNTFLSLWWAWGLSSFACYMACAMLAVHKAAKMGKEFMRTASSPSSSRYPGLLVRGILDRQSDQRLTSDGVVVRLARRFGPIAILGITGNLLMLASAVAVVVNVVLYVKHH